MIVSARCAIDPIGFLKTALSLWYQRKQDEVRVVVADGLSHQLHPKVSTDRLRRSRQRAERDRLVPGIDQGAARSMYLLTTISLMVG